MDFNAGTIPTINGNYFNGNLLNHVGKNQRPFIPYAHFETSIDIKSGASGGPVFNADKKIVGVNCRGWNFKGSEHEGNNLSSVVPISACLEMPFPLPQLPTGSWEYNQIPESKRNGELSVAELARYGHILFEPTLSF